MNRRRNKKGKRNMQRRKKVGKRLRKRRQEEKCVVYRAIHVQHTPHTYLPYVLDVARSIVIHDPIQILRL